MHDGDPAEIKIDTFNFTKYGCCGPVINVSQDAACATRHRASGADKQVSQSTLKRPSARSCFSPRAFHLINQHADRRRLRTAPGMAVTVEINRTAPRHRVPAIAIAALQAGELARAMTTVSLSLVSCCGTLRFQFGFQLGFHINGVQLNCIDTVTIKHCNSKRRFRGQTISRVTKSAHERDRRGRVYKRFANLVLFDRA